MFFTISKEAVLNALRRVNDPMRGVDIISLNMVGGLHISRGEVSFTINIDPSMGPAMEDLRQHAESAVMEIGRASCRERV